MKIEKTILNLFKKKNNVNSYLWKIKKCDLLTIKNKKNDINTNSKNIFLKVGQL